MPHPVGSGTHVLFMFVGILLSDRAVAAAQDRVDVFQALILRRPVMEQEVETQVQGASGGSGHEVGVTTAIDVRLARRWQIEVTVPFLLSTPANEPATAGISDVVVEHKVLLFESLSLRARGAVCPGVRVSSTLRPEGVTAVPRFLPLPGTARVRGTPRTRSARRTYSQA